MNNNSKSIGYQCCINKWEILPIKFQGIAGSLSFCISHKNYILQNMFLLSYPRNNAPSYAERLKW